VPVFGPEVGCRTSSDTQPLDHAQVVAGYGFEPGLALRDLRKLAQIEAKAAYTDEADSWEAIGVQLVAGPVPDHQVGERGATRNGWVAFGTLIRHPAAAQSPGSAGMRRAG
jgi:hypothetical protein